MRLLGTTLTAGALAFGLAAGMAQAMPLTNSAAGLKAAADESNLIVQRRCLQSRVPQGRGPGMGRCRRVASSCRQGVPTGQMHAVTSKVGALSCSTCDSAPRFCEPEPNCKGSPKKFGLLSARLQIRRTARFAFAFGRRQAAPDSIFPGPPHCTPRKKPVAWPMKSRWSADHGATKPRSPARWSPET